MNLNKIIKVIFDWRFLLLLAISTYFLNGGFFSELFWLFLSFAILDIVLAFLQTFFPTQYNYLTRRDKSKYVSNYILILLLVLFLGFYFYLKNYLI